MVLGKKPLAWCDILTKYLLLNVIKGIRRVKNSVNKNITVLNYQFQNQGKTWLINWNFE